MDIFNIEINQNDRSYQVEFKEEKTDTHSTKSGKSVRIDGRTYRIIGSEEALKFLKAKIPEINKKNLSSMELTQRLQTLNGCIHFPILEKTRQALARYSNNHPAVLKTFDRLASSWIAYQKTTEANFNLEQLLKAIEFAAEKHQGQMRNDPEDTPYIIHPIAVCELLWNIGNIRDINILSSALLHDTLEDTDASEEEIKELFGEKVLNTVEQLTNDPDLSARDNKQRQIDHVPKMSHDGRLVKLADRLHNVSGLNRPPVYWSKSKVDEYYGWGEKLLSALKGTNKELENALEKLIVDHKR